MIDPVEPECIKVPVTVLREWAKMLVEPQITFTLDPLALAHDLLFKLRSSNDRLHGMVNSMIKERQESNGWFHSLPKNR